jgi:uncharacterized metal-binding protein YceD (DUF177 family)
VLLALPLVPMHENTNCAEGVKAASEVAEETSDDDDAGEPVEDDGVRQQPFRNLRDLMRK